MTVILKELVEILNTLLELPVKLSVFLDMDAKLCCVGVDVFLLFCVPYNSKNSCFQTTSYFFWEDKTVVISLEAAVIFWSHMFFLASYGQFRLLCCGFHNCILFMKYDVGSVSSYF